MILKSTSSQATLDQLSGESKYPTLVIAIIYGFMAQVYTALYFRVTVDQGPVGLVSLANFSAYRPYQYRILVPGIVHLIARITHADSYQILSIYQCCEWIAAFVSFWIYRSYLATFVSQQNATLLSFTLLPVLLFLHVSCAMYHYPYDTPAIALFTLGLLALRRQNWTLFYAALVVGVLNRESSLLLIGAFVLVYFDKLPLKLLCSHLAAQILVFAAIKLALDRIFVHNLGNFTENHIIYNNGLLFNIAHLQPIIFGTFAMTSLAFGIFFVGRRHVPAFPIRLLWLVPFYIAVMYKVGILDEIRAYNEMVPVILTPILLILHGTLSGNKQAENADETPLLKAA